MRDTILIIDDEADIRMLLGRILELEGYNVLKAKDRRSALDTLRSAEVAVVLCDVFLPDGNGIDMISELLRISPLSKIVMLTAHGNIADGVQAIKNGAFDYIVKGDDNRKIIPIVSRAQSEFDKSHGIDNSRNTHLDPKHPTTFDAVVGQSEVMKQAQRLALKVASTDVAVLLTGETGTGKEVFARAIHNSSARASKSFVAVNCSAFSSELLESSIFGHKAGAFTGALKDKKGLFEEADGGTIFLDEIGEMAFELQAKLLRVLETGEFIKVGDTKPTKVNVRIISATNRNLKAEIEKSNFRQDLFFRLSVFQITLPALRNRVEDIPLLVNSFVQIISANFGMKAPGVADDCMELLMRYSWPGNVRELQNVVERALIIADDDITIHDLPIELISSTSVKSDSEQVFDLQTVERNHISKVLEYTKGNKTEAARLLKIGLTTLYRKIEEYSIK